MKVVLALEKVIPKGDKKCDPFCCFEVLSTSRTLMGFFPFLDEFCPEGLFQNNACFDWNLVGKSKSLYSFFEGILAISEAFRKLTN